MVVAIKDVMPASSQQLAYVPTSSYNDTAPTAIYTLSLHDALPISRVVISSTSQTAATARCHSAGSSSAGPCASAIGRSIRAGTREHRIFGLSHRLTAVLRQNRGGTRPRRPAGGDQLHRRTSICASIG